MLLLNKLRYLRLLVDFNDWDILTNPSTPILVLLTSNISIYFHLSRLRAREYAPSIPRLFRERTRLLKQAGFVLIESEITNTYAMLLVNPDLERFISFNCLLAATSFANLGGCGSTRDSYSFIENSRSRLFE